MLVNFIIVAGLVIFHQYDIHVYYVRQRTIYYNHTLGKDIHFVLIVMKV